MRFPIDEEALVFYIDDSLTQDSQVFVKPKLAAAVRERTESISSSNIEVEVPVKEHGGPSVCDDCRRDSRLGGEVLNR